MTNIAHIPKPQHPDRFQSWCGERMNGFRLMGLNHAASCVVVGTLVQPCKRCVAAAVAVLTGNAKYESDPAQQKEAV